MRFSYHNYLEEYIMQIYLNYNGNFQKIMKYKIWINQALLKMYDKLTIISRN